jgi:tetratricopeptide (TPR) repeat protein
VLFRMPWASLVHGQIGRAVQLLQDATQAFDDADATAAQLHALQAWLLLWQGQRQRATALAMRALQALEGRPQVAGRVMALRTLGHAARLDGQHARSAQHLAEGMRQAQAAGLRAIQALMQDGLAMALNMLGRHDEARAAIEAASRINDDAGDATQRVYNLYNLSQSHSLAGEADQALPWARQALDLAQRIGFAYFLPHAHVELALVHLELRQFDPARHELEAGRRLASDHQDFVTLAATHEAVARLALAEGDRGRAWHHVGVAAQLCLEHHYVTTGASVLLTAARLLGSTPPAPDWLDALAALPDVQEPVRRQALAARGASAQALPDAAPPSLRQLLAQLIASAHD